MEELEELKKATYNKVNTLSLAVVDGLERVVYVLSSLVHGGDGLLVRKADDGLVEVLLLLGGELAPSNR